MAEKMYSFTHVISETKLQALIAANADEVRVDIYVPEKKSYKSRPQIANGAASAPLLLEGPGRGRSKAQTESAPVHKAPARGAKPKTASAMVLRYLADHSDRIVMMSELEQYIKKHGKSVGAISVALAGFVAKGLVERPSKGHYRILKEGLKKVAAADAEPDKKAKAAKPAKPDKKAKPDTKPVRGLGRELVWNELAKGEPVKRVDVSKAFKERKLQPNSVGGALESFVKKGFASKINFGVYQITPEGIAHHNQLQGATT